MDVVYVGKDSLKRDAALKTRGDVILLLFDRWDDFDYKTRFPTYCRIAGNEVELDAVKILIEDQSVSFSYLDELVVKGWDGVFPIPETLYISTPEALTFYEQIEGHLDLSAAIEVARKIRDASYMVRIAEDDRSVRMTHTAGFKKSLQRERGSIKAFLDGWRFFSRQGISIGDLTFHFRSTAGDIQPLRLNFASDNLLPHDINVLIGPNGVGKSQALLQIVQHWLEFDPDAENDIRFGESPNINQVVVVSYSPFELFPLDSAANDADDGVGRQDHGVYRYFGLRAPEVIDEPDGKKRTTARLSRHWPRRNAAYSLVACLEDDLKYGSISDWSAKVETMGQVLRTAIDFDDLAIGVHSYDDDGIFFEDREWAGDDAVIPVDNIEAGTPLPKAYIPIRSFRVSELNTDMLRKHVHETSGIVFLKDNVPVELSSGQRLFSYIVANILGAMRRNSLILIDEPELFLHPTLEIAFIRMLKRILASYDSKALLATHSLVTVRELPRDCVHVFERTKEGIFVKHPPFETFGGDIQRISSYVFGDKSVSKPFEEWLREKLKEYGSADELIRALGDNVNEEMLIQIHAMGEGKW